MKKTPLKRTSFLKKTPLNLKKSPIKKISTKGKEKKIEDVEETKKMWQFFWSIWENSVHRCESCNVYLGAIPATYMFDHLLEKSKYPELRLEKENIALVCLECHNSKTNGHPTQKHLELINKIKQIYGK